MARPSTNDDAKVFLSTLKRCKATVGNGFLRTKLNWSEDRYWKAHSLLLEKGRIVRGRGRGGSITAT